MNSIFAKISSRENISNSLFAKFSSRENKVLYSIPASYYYYCKCYAFPQKSQHTAMQRSSFQENGLNARKVEAARDSFGPHQAREPFALGPRSISLPAAVTCVALQSPG